MVVALLRHHLGAGQSEIRSRRARVGRVLMLIVVGSGIAEIVLALGVGGFEGVVAHVDVIGG